MSNPARPTSTPPNHRRSRVMTWFRQHLRVPVTGLLLACFGMWSSQVRGATLFWDNDANAANNSLLTGAGLGAAGNWNNSLSGTPLLNWYNGTSDTSWVNANNDTAAFWGTAGTVTLTDAITVGGLLFKTTGYTISTGANTLTFGATNDTITLDNIAAVTITGSVGGTGNITLTGGAYGGQTAGTLTLNGTSAGGWSGTTTINNGMTMALAGSNQALLNTTGGITLNGGGITLTNTTNTEAALDRVNASAITSNGGLFTVTNTAGVVTSYAETIGSVALTSGRLNVVSTNALASGTSLLTLGGLTQAGTSSIGFGIGGLTSAGITTNQINIAGFATTAANQIIGPWATVGATAAAQTDYAVYNINAGTGNARGVQGAGIAGTAQTAWTASTDSYTQSSALETLGGTRTITALRNTATTATTALGANNLETFGLLNGATTPWTISGTGAVRQQGTAAANVYVNAGSGAVSISAPINNNTGALTLVKDGAGVLTLSSTTSTYSGGTVINAGTVAVAANTNLGATTGGITFNGTGNLRFDGAVALGARPIAVGSGATATFTSNNVAATTSSATSITGAGNVVLSGGIYGGQTAGGLTLSGTATGGWSGSTMINNGMTLSLTTSNQALLNTSAITLNSTGAITVTKVSTDNTDRIANAAPITSNGGTLTFTNTVSAATPYAETVGAIALNSGTLNIVSTNANTGGTENLTLSGLTQAGTAAVRFGAGGFVSAGTATNQINITGQATTTNTIIGPWATVGTTAAGQSDYATYNFSGGTTTGTTGLNTGGAVTTTGLNGANITAVTALPTAASTWDATSNVNFANGTTGTTLTATTNLNTLRYTGGAASIALSTFNLGTYGVLQAGSGLLTISGTGALTLPTTAAGNVYLTTGTAQGITVSAPINNNTGALTLVIGGQNTVTLSSTTSTFSGGLVMNGGTVAISADTNLGATTGGVTFNSSANLTTVTNGVTIGATRTVTLNNGALATITVSNVAGNSIAGKVTGAGGLIFVPGGTTGNTLTLSNTGNDFQGSLRVATSTTAAIAAISSLADSASANGAIRLGGTTGGGTFQWATTSTGPLTLNNRQIDLAGTTGGGTIDNANTTAANFITVNTDLLISGTGAKTLTFTGANTGANTFAGTIFDGSGSVITVAKNGAGTWTLSNTNNTFTGGFSFPNTTANVGTLTFASAGSAGGITTTATTAGWTLKYAGTSAGGQTTSGALNLGTKTNDSVGGVALDASGTGAWNLSNTGAIAVGAGAKTITLTGTNTGSNTLAGIVQDNSGVNTTSITKTGAGNWILSGANTYTGTTTISTGTLQLGNALAVQNSTVAVNANNGLAFSSGITNFTLGNLSGTGNLSLTDVSAAAVNLTIGGNNASPAAYSGNLSGAGNIIKTGTGTTTLGGTGSTNSGTITVNGGTLSVNPSALSSTTGISIGSAGAGTLDLYQDGAGVTTNLAANTNLLLGGAANTGSLGFQLGTNSDRLVLSGTGALTVGAGGGLINAQAVTGFGVGTYSLITGPNAATYTGTLSTGVLPAGFGYTLDTATAGTVKLVVAAAPATMWWAGDINGSWNTVNSGGLATNWATDNTGAADAAATPGTGSTVNFSATGAGNFTTTLDAVFSIAGLNITNNVASAVTINSGSGGTLKLGSGGIAVQTGAPVQTTINAPITLGADQTWNVVDSGSELIANGGIIAGGFVLTKSGSGQLTLGANTVLDAINGTGSSGTVSIGSGFTLAVGTATNLNSSYSGAVAGLGALTKAGTGTLTLSGLSGTAASNYAGTTTIDRGTLAITTNNASFTGGLTFGSTNATTTVGALDLSSASATFGGATLVQTNSASANTITIGAGKTLTSNGNVTVGVGGTGTNNNLTVSGATGTWAVSGSGLTFSFGGSANSVSSQTLDMSGLGTFNSGISGTPLTLFRVGSTDTAGSSADTLMLLKLATTSNIYATTLTLGNGGAAGHTTVSTLQIGSGTGASKTLINADTINIGSSGGSSADRSSGKIEFASGTGEVTIRGADGTSAVTNLNLINTAAGTSASLNADLLLAGHSSDVSATNLTMAKRTSAASWISANNTANLTFDLGSFTATTVIMSQRSGAAVTTGSTIANATFGGGTVTLGTVTMSDNSATTATTTGAAQSTLTFNGAGTNSIATLNMGNNAVTGASAAGNTTDATLALGGTAATTISGNLNMAVNAATAAAGATTAKSTINLNSGSLTVNGNITMGDVTVNGKHSTNNVININGGTLQVDGNITRTSTASGAGTQTATINLSGGTLDMTNGTIGGAIAVTLNATSGTLKNLAELNAGGTLTKTGTGTLILSGINNYTGATIVNGGTLSIAAGAIPNSSSLQVGATGNGIFDLYQDGIAATTNLALNANIILGSATTSGALGFQLGTAGSPGTSDKLVLSGTGAVTIAAGGGVFNFQPLTGFGIGSYDLITGAASISGTPTIGTLPSGYGYSLVTGASTISLNVTAAAATMFWAGDLSGSWNTVNSGGAATNWSTSATAITPDAASTPGTGTTVNFSSIGAANYSTTLDTAFSIAGLNYADTRNKTGAPVSIAPGTGGTLQINGTTSAISLAAGAPTASSISAPVILGADNTWTATDATTTFTVSGAVSETGGARALSKAGAGTLILSGANNYTGVTTVSAGVLNIQNSTALGTTAGNTSVTTGAALQIQGVGLSIAEPLSLNGTGIGGTGALRNISGNNTVSGLVTLATTGVRINSDSGTLTLDVASGDAIAGTSGFGLTLGGAGNGVVADPINTGTGALTKDGAGTWILSGANTYSGLTTIGGGTLQVGNGTTGSLNGTTGTALTFTDSGAFTVSEALGVAQGMGALTFTNGDGTVQSINNGGTSTLTFASLAARASGATGNFVLTNGGASNTIMLTSTTNAPLAASGSNNQGYFFGGSNYARYSVANNTFQAVAYGTDSNAQTAIAGGATLGVNNAAFDVQITAPITAQTTAVINTLNISGNQNFTLAASQTLTVNGILKSGNVAGGAIISGGTGITPGAGAEMVIRTDGASDTLQIATPVLTSGTNVLTKSGAGTLILQSANTYTGATNVDAGTLQLRNLLGAGTSAGGVFVRTGATLKTSLTGTYATEALSLNGTGVGGTGALVADVTATWSGAVTIATNSTINVAQGAAFTISTAPVFTGDVTKTGAGTLLIPAVPTGTGAMNINAGTVNIASSRLPGAITVNNTGTLLLTGSGTNSVSDTAVNTINSGGAFDFQQTGTETMGTLLLNGSGINNAGALANNGAAVNGGVITVTNGIILQSNTSLGAANGSTLKIITPITSNGFTLTKEGPGTLTSTSITTGSTVFGAGSIVLNGGTLALVPGTAGSYAMVGANNLPASTFTYGSSTGAGGNLTLTRNTTALSYTIGNASPTSGGIDASNRSTVLVRGGRGTMVIQPTALANLGVAGNENFVVNGLTNVANKNGAAASTGIYDASVVALASNVGTFVRYSAIAANGFEDAATATSSYTSATTGTPATNSIQDLTTATAAATFTNGNPYAIRVNPTATLTISGTTTVNVGSPGTELEFAL